MQDIEYSRQQMIEQQLRAWGVHDPRVLCVFDQVQRETFVPERFAGLAFADTEIPLGYGEVMMAPKVEGRMLQALTVMPTDRVLEIGTGSGWMTALLATLGAEVHSIELRPEFTDAARQKLDANGITNALLETRDAARMAGGPGGYDVVAVTGALPRRDARFEALLNPGGRLFAIIGEPPAMEALLVTCEAPGVYTVASLFETVLAPLHNFEPVRRFAL